MEIFPPEIIQKIAFFCIQKEDLTKDVDFFMKLHVLSPNFIDKQSLKNVLNLSLSSKELYNILWNSQFFWKDVVKNYFHTLENYVKLHKHKLLVKLAVTRRDQQCKRCKFFCTTEVDRLICLVDSKLIIYVYCEICQIISYSKRN